MTASIINATAFPSVLGRTTAWSYPSPLTIVPIVAIDINKAAMPKSSGEYRRAISGIARKPIPRAMVFPVRRVATLFMKADCVIY